MEKIVLKLLENVRIVLVVFEVGMELKDILNIDVKEIVFEVVLFEFSVLVESEILDISVVFFEFLFGKIRWYFLLDWK